MAPLKLQQTIPSTCTHSEKISFHLYDRLGTELLVLENCELQVNPAIRNCRGKLKNSLLWEFRCSENET